MRSPSKSRAGWRLLAAALSAAVALPSQAAAPHADASVPSSFDRPRLAVLPGGRTIALHCAGHGAVTVLLFAGAGDWADNWRPIVGPLARNNRVCAWDRAGYGFSGASPERQDVLHTERDLEVALRTAGINPPFVLGAHSLGAYEALLFADRRPTQVSGMVLVDPSFPDQDRLLRLSSPEAAAFMDRQLSELVAVERRCADHTVHASKSGHALDCFKAPLRYPSALRARLKAIYADLDAVRTRISFSEEMGRDSALAVDPSRRFGTLPLIVLTAANDPSSLVGLPASITAFLSAHWVTGHDALAELSSKGSNRVVAGTTHYIYLQKPEVVIEAIQEVMAETQ